MGAGASCGRAGHHPDPLARGGALATLIIFSFRLGNPWDPGGFTLDHYAAAYSNPQTYSMFFNTALLAGFSTAISVALATFFAYLTERTDMPFRNVAWGLILSPWPSRDCSLRCPGRFCCRRRSAFSISGCEAFWDGSEWMSPPVR